MKSLQEENNIAPAKKTLATALLLILMIGGGASMMELFISYLAPATSSFGASLPLFILMVLLFTTGLFMGVVFWMLLMKPFLTKKQMKAWLSGPVSPEGRYAFIAPVMKRVLLRILRMVY